jgi:hypothetical protein
MTTQEDYTGADCSGSDGDENRVLTLANTDKTISDGFMVFVERNFQTPTSDYTVTHNDSSSTVTLVSNTYDDSPITVIYNTILTQVAPTTAQIPLDARFIQKNIAALGNTCTITEISRSYGTDEYRTKTETETNRTNLPCYVHVLSLEDESVKQGEARAGDLVFWFDASYVDYCVQGNRITWNSDTYQIKNVEQFRAVGNTLMLIECVVEQI